MSETANGSAVAAAQAAVRALRERVTHLDNNGLDLLFREARSHYAWSDRPVTDDELRALYDLLKFGPTSGNGNPARFVFVRNPERKRALAACVAEGNVAKVLGSPVTVIIAYDKLFWREFPTLFPMRDMAGPFRANPAAAETAAFRNSSLQGAYLILAARSLGLDTGPMSGFDNAAVDAEFLARDGWTSNFLCNLGHGDETKLFQRLPRLAVEVACRFE